VGHDQAPFGAEGDASGVEGGQSRVTVNVDGFVAAGGHGEQLGEL
jgi:hypothetical protein